MDWMELQARCSQCHGCSLGDTRTNLVFGTGSKTAEVMLVGEGPGKDEDLQGIPFVGKAGQLLDEMLSIIDLDRTQVYICNIVKCRPPNNRDPLAVEQDACIKWLREQTRLIRPKIIVCLGRIAAQRLIDQSFSVTKQHGNWIEKGGIKMMATYHPAALLRDDTKKPDAFFDLKSLQSEILKTCSRTYPVDYRLK